MTTQRNLQNNRLLWVDIRINEDDSNTQHVLEYWRAIVHHVDLFTKTNDCVQFLDRLKNEQVLVVTSGSLGEHFVKQIHDLPQVVAICIFSRNPDRHQSWANQWSKIKGVYNRITPICNVLRTAVKQSNEDLTPISFITQSESCEEESMVDWNRFESSFIYIALFKRILIDMKHGPDEKQVIVKFCRTHYANNPIEFKIVKEFSRDYQHAKAIWWYTRECFLYQIINRALRLLESDVIVDMSFFIHDLHQQLQQLHHEQFSNYQGASLTFYRSQALLTESAKKLQEAKGGLIAFNSFLSTTTIKSVSLHFARQNALRDNMVGILFVITADPKIGSAVFADVGKHSYAQTESEVMFSMHTIFRILDIVVLDKEQRLFEVQLTLISEDDQELNQLVDRIEANIEGDIQGEECWKMLSNMKQLDKIAALFLALLKQEPSERDQGHYYQRLGAIKYMQADYNSALEYYERATSIREKILSPTNLALASSYGNIGSVYSAMEQYSRSLLYHRKALAIQQKTLPANHLLLASTYNYIGQGHLNSKEYSIAQANFEKALEIRERSLPEGHPDIQVCLKSIEDVKEILKKEAVSIFLSSLIEK